MKIGFLLLVLVSAGLANATPILTLDVAVQTGSVGETLVFTGFLTNPNDAPLYINSDTLTVDIPLVGDDTPFLTNVPPSIPGYTSTADLVLFNITIPKDTPLGEFTGELHIMGGADEYAQTELGAVSFSVINQSPEPSSALLLVPSLCLLVLLKRRLRAN